jgi:hypothetical protein
VDADDQEADRVAEQVMYASTAETHGQTAPILHGRRQPAPDRTAAPAREALRRIPAEHGVAEETSAPTDGVPRSTGRPLDDASRALMEARFGYDFGHVRVHTDAYAAESARRAHAVAYTVGRDIVFGAGQYAPETAAGRRVLAHELTHVVQQADHPAQMQRLIRTPYPWRGVIVPAIGANIRGTPDATDPSNILDSIPRGQTVTVISATGNWLRVQSRYRGPMVEGFIFHTLVDDAASSAMAATVGTTMVWRPSGPGSGTDFQTWASAPSETPFPAVTTTTVMNCWEAVLLAAYRAGAITWSWIHNLYTAVPFVPAGNWATTMSRGPRHTYAVPGPNLMMPQRGDLVFFNGIAHVALATGNGSDVYTFWPPPNTPFSPPPGGTTDQVKVYSIEDIVAWWTANMPGALVVEFAAPAW